MKTQLIQKDVEPIIVSLYGILCPGCDRVLTGIDTVSIKGMNSPYNINNEFAEIAKVKTIINEKSNSNDGLCQYLCPYCNYEFPTKDIIDIKSWTLLSAFSLKCQVCGEITPRIDSYASETDQNAFPCIRCGVILDGGEGYNCNFDRRGRKRNGCIRCQFKSKRISPDEEE